MPARILIVEDDWLIASDYVRALKAAGHIALGPFSGVAPALTALADQAVDAALLDLHLGHENSLPVAAALKGRGIPFAFLTGHQTVDLPEDFHDRSVISKPVTHAILLDSVSRMLGT